jgi:hypothetical protein
MRKNKIGNVEKWFQISVMILLAITAGSKLWSATGSAKILNYQNELFLIPNRYVMLSSACVEILIVACLATIRSLATKLYLCAVLATAFCLYKLIMHSIGSRAPCPCLGTLTDRLHLQPETVAVFLNGFVLYMLFGSLILLMRHFYFRKDELGEPWPYAQKM